jgi:hypothetical protein
VPPKAADAPPSAPPDATVSAIPDAAPDAPGRAVTAATLVAALSLATCSAAFSISGLTAIFAGATGPVVGLGIAFEIGKLSAVARLRLLPAHSSDGDQWFQTIVITVSSDRDQAQHELFTVLSIGAAAVLLLLAATADKRRMEGA